MLSVRIAITDPAKREAHIEAHKRYLREAPLHILFSGPLVADGGTARALIVTEVADLAEMEAFSIADPFVANGVYQGLHILAGKLRLSQFGDVLPIG